MAHGILFDFNGVLIDDEHLHLASLTATLAEYGRQLSPEEYYRDYLGFDDRECFRFSFAQLGRPTDEAALAQAVERKSVRYQAAVRRSMTLVPGAVEFVHNAAAQGMRLAIVSAALRREIEFVLAETELRQHFPIIIAAEDVPACKPDPAGYQAAHQALGTNLTDTLVIEDSLPGLAAARAAGLRCAMLTTSHPAETLVQAGADAVWPDFLGRHPQQLPWPNA